MLRRELLAAGASAAAALAGTTEFMDFDRVLFERQASRRKELWSLLGDLPARRPVKAKLLDSSKRKGFTLEKLELDLNGIEQVPAYFLIPERIRPPAATVLYLHYHGGNYDRGKNELLEGFSDQGPYATVFAELGLPTLAIDSWCFGERKKDANGSVGESDTFKLMLWQGRVLWGMMLFDLVQAIDYLQMRPEVDSQRIAAMGMSMGATQAWWLAALDERVKLCIDLCCLTDYDELIRSRNLRGHGIYYYVPRLLKHFSTSEINELIVPRRRLSMNGRFDKLTPPAGVERVRDHLLPLYAKMGRSDACRIELFPCGHQETPTMRQMAIAALVARWD